jgi:hypothetical protein
VSGVVRGDIAIKPGKTRAQGAQCVLGSVNLNAVLIAQANLDFIFPTTQPAWMIQTVTPSLRRAFDRDPVTDGIDAL